MTTRLQDFGLQCREQWQALEPRARTIVTAVASMICAIIFIWVVQALEHSRAELQSTVAALREQAAKVEQQASEFEQLRAQPPAVVSSADVRGLVQGQMNAAGLSRAVRSMDAAEPNQVGVALGAVGFSDWLDLVASLNAQQIRLETCRIEALSTPGQVSVTATLVRSR
ncbi:MAG: type secretion system protein [Betaproteobacteria bacterium]|nr:type secretion system protein [Betaproteobacteria bacterium]